RGEDHKAAADWAIKALQQDERSGLAWHLLAIAREKAGDFRTSLQCYESALQLLPDEAEIANDLGRLAYRLDMKDAAAKLFLHYLDRYPGSEEAANNLACVLRDDNRYDDAVAVLRPVIQASPAQPLLWN
ncbi:tetratricopeptide repeat protein, partial [Pandoraea nosoerga]|nr:tetratricopeptide repeat protein [Pandoraea nosoerga]